MTTRQPRRMEPTDLVAWAHDIAEEHLAPLGRRWRHVQQVAARAEEVAALVPGQRSTLVAAAFLHDIGYAPSLVQTGFHPIDGGRFVRRHGHEHLARLVAHHTGARDEASLNGLDGVLAAEFPFEDSELDRLLAYCDLTTGPDGTRVTVAERVREICRRYGDELPARSARRCLPGWLRLERDVENRLAGMRRGSVPDGTDQPASDS